MNPWKREIKETLPGKEQFLYEKKGKVYACALGAIYWAEVGKIDSPPVIGAYLRNKYPEYEKVELMVLNDYTNNSREDILLYLKDILK